MIFARDFSEALEKKIHHGCLKNLANTFPGNVTKRLAKNVCE